VRQCSFNVVMEVHRDKGDRLPETDELPHLQQVLEEVRIEHPEVLAWIAEAKRLFAEAEDRFEAGRILSALSSLSAVPPIHHMLTERFAGLLLTAESSEPSEVEAPTGLYL
jgi:hypothetical protein